MTFSNTVASYSTTITFATSTKLSIAMNIVNIYTDGSVGPGDCNKECGGIGIFSEYNKIDNVSIHIDGENLSIHIVEAIAIRTALVLYFDVHNIVIHTDSQHCYVLLLRFKHNYKQSTWSSNSTSLVLGFDILIHCLELYQRRKQCGRRTKFEKVKAHNNNFGNTWTDRLANQGRFSSTKEDLLLRPILSIPSYYGNTVAKVIDNLEFTISSAFTKIKMGNKSKAIPSTVTGDKILTSSSTLLSTTISDPKIDKSPSVTSTNDIRKQYKGTIFSLCLLCTRVVRSSHTKCSSTVFSSIPTTDSPCIVVGYCKTCRTLPGISSISNNINGSVSTLLISTSPLLSILKKAHTCDINIGQSNGALLSVPISSITDGCNQHCWYDSIDTNSGNSLSRLNGGFI